MRMNIRAYQPNSHYNSIDPFFHLSLSTTTTTMMFATASRRFLVLTSLFLPAVVTGSVKLALSNGRVSQCQTLWAKQTIPVGSVCVDADQKNPDQLIVAYTTMDGWKLEEAHLWIGRNVSLLPMQNKTTDEPDGTRHIQQDPRNNIKSPHQESVDLSQFPFQKDDLSGKHAHYGFIVKLHQLGFACPEPKGTVFHAEAHATVTARPSLRNGNVATLQSAWASPVAPYKEIQNVNKGVDFNFTLVCDVRNDPPKDAPVRHFANKLPQ
jgi:hypothetical protein